MRLQIFENLWEQWVRARDKEKKEKEILKKQVYCSLSQGLFNLAESFLSNTFYSQFKDKIILKILQFDLPCGFSKNVSSKERVKLWFFANFKIILRHIFPENFIEFLPVVQKI